MPIKINIPSDGTGAINPNDYNLNIGTIVSKFLPYVFAVAGIILMIYLVMGGFEYMTSAGDPKKTASAQGKITTALIGFLIILASYWIVQLFGKVFNLSNFI